MPDYPPPVDQLLRLGEPRSSWQKYPKLGLGPEHIPELMRMAADPELNGAPAESREVWAPVHAWRALGQLHAVEAVTLLLEVCEREDLDDWATENIPQALAMIGPGAIPALADWLADAQGIRRFRMPAAEALARLAEQHPEARAACIAELTRVLDSDGRDPELNGWIVGMLLDLKAREAAPVIEKAYAEGRVEPNIAGTWPRVQFDLGLTDVEPDDHYNHPGAELFDLPFPEDYMQEPPPGFRPFWRSAQSAKERADQRKKKRKAAAKARKRNRKHH